MIAGAASCLRRRHAAGTVQARQSQGGESFVALDEETYELNATDCVIADDRGVLVWPVLWAGVGQYASDKKRAGRKRVV